MAKGSFLLAESGATKTEWRWYREAEGVASFRSLGLNPSTLGSSHIHEALSKIFSENGLQEVEKVIFYGAGLSSPAYRKLLLTSLQQHLSASSFTLHTDLEAAAHATQRSEGIVCILGTGSNSCLFKNGKIHQRRGGWGYLVGDEGGGADLGRQFIKGMAHNFFSPEIKAYVEYHYEKSLYEIIIDIQNNPRPNLALASLSPHISHFSNVPEIRRMLQKRFRLFLETTVCHFEESARWQIDMVGSIGYYYTEFLQLAMDEKGLKMGKCILSPIDALFERYLSENS
ncbi:MAG: BadF/BadG/BcrA/BcrD ATPase family protein [Bacteroidota bacterium]